MISSICALVIAAGLAAQDTFDVKVAEPSLLQHVSVQKELNMTPQQITSVEKLRTDLFAKFKANGNWNTEEFRAANRLLDPGQARRLREITLQRNGPLMLMMDDVAKRVGLSAAEQKGVHTLFQKTVEEAMEPMKRELARMGEELGKKAAGNPDEARKLGKEMAEKSKELSKKIDHEKLAHGADTQILASLSPSQRQTWQELLGKPFPVETLKKVK